jgi:DNA-binding NtrC family response regulator
MVSSDSHFNEQPREAPRGPNHPTERSPLPPEEARPATTGPSAIGPAGTDFGSSVVSASPVGGQPSGLLSRHDGSAAREDVHPPSPDSSGSNGNGGAGAEAVSTDFDRPVAPDARPIDNHPKLTEAGKVLIVDDEPAMCETLRLGLGKRGYEVTTATSLAQALQKMAEERFESVLTDLHLGDGSGLDICKHVADRWPDVPVVVITAFGSMDSAIQAIRAGAYDYITKPIEIEPLTLTIERALAHHRLKTEVRRLREQSGITRPYEQMVGESPAMRRVFDLLSRLEDSVAPVLITGESGTGKELVARALHQRSPSGTGPFVAINCAAVPATLLESTLFGHVKGAFTDAKQSRHGLFVEANGGTLFLDEIGEMPLEMQAKLLRVLQERHVRPVGGDREIPFDTRIVTATNRDLEEEVAEARFREDLYYRVNVVAIRVPPLRARGNDVLLLAQYFLEQIAERTGKEVVGLDVEVARKLLSYSWPGNVRELENVVERAVALTRYDKLSVEDLPDKILEHKSKRFVLESDEDIETMPPLSDVERRYIERVLEAAGGNKTLAARVLGLDRRTLYRKLERWNREARQRRPEKAAAKTAAAAQ